MPETAAGRPPGPEPAPERARWLAVLDELEAQLAAASAARGGGARLQAAAAWTAPKDLGPLPEDLVDRATRLAAAQQEAIAALRSAVRSARQQSAYLDAVPKASGPGAAVYLDLNG
ncbi:hypothetical protein [Arthrobacter mobilis]|uniref:FlgN protein n=1 Tax=Arthrobacter mobilis TaxID=2724944 RepID=A0A7X6HAP4_9MICC|nr:hypothetical protein [Arthrobacter mobilis]NKX53606.1 hypothetical protein [Arthrobacter mobilis]